MRHFQKNKIAASSINFQSWESQQIELYAQIQAFAIDYPGAAFPFNQRLARDHQWSSIYTQRVIEEYKKFLFLAMVAGHPVTPSNTVDQAWHLHLTYTHSYWDNLCTQILPRPLHHHPTQGGQQQRELFWDCYSKTLDSYERFFGYAAPVDIWPTPVNRFRQSGQFKQLNSQDYWVIPKPGFALSQRVFWKISHLPWLRKGMITLLIIGLVFSLNCLYHSAIAASVDLINITIAQPTLAQVSSSPNSYAPADSTAKPAQDYSWILSIIGFFSIVFIINWIDSSIVFISNWIDSWCPVCSRFWLEKTTTVLCQPTEQKDGVELVTKRCKCCKYTKQQIKRIPRQSYGCGGGCTC